MPGRIWIILGALFAGLAVALGALGAHALEEYLKQNDPRHNFETAARYQMYHALALVLLGLAASQRSIAIQTAAGWLFVAGILLFSGGLYGWIFTAIKPFVHIVPIGGVLWICGWLCFALAQFRRP